MASRTQAKPEKVSYTFPAPAVPISASLSHPSVNECHCSGVNAVVVDAARSLMYSAGRDTSIRAWSFGDHRTLTSAKTAPSASSIPVRHLNSIYCSSTFCFLPLHSRSNAKDDTLALQYLKYSMPHNPLNSVIPRNCIDLPLGLPQRLGK